MQPSHYDVAVIGGGIAGLWVHNRLRRAGYRSVLLEAQKLGGGQTLASQGMIHGGVKYLLADGDGSAAAVAAMPARWRLCLAGHGELDLRHTHRLSEHSFLWSNERLLGELGTLLASRMLRGRAQRLPRQQFPPLLRTPAFRGIVYRLEDVIVDPQSLLQDLHRQANQDGPSTFCCAVSAADLQRTGERVTAVTTPAGRIQFDQLVLAAGAGNAALGGGAMQLRGLHQLWLELPPQLAELAGDFFGHCITGIARAEPRVTISSHARADGGRVWYLGGALAGDGVDLDAEAQRQAAIHALGSCLPWLNVPRANLHTLRIDRAEAASASGNRPEGAYVARRGNIVTCWPTKLTLAPDVGDRVLALLDPPSGRPAPSPPALPAARVGLAPWDLPVQTVK